MDRILFNQDNDLFKEIMNDFHEYKEPLSNVRNAYNKLEINEFNNEVYQSIVKKGADETIKTFYENMISQFDASNIKSSVIRASMMAQTQDVTTEFKNSVLELKTFKPYYVKNRIGQRTQYLKPEHICFIDNKFVVTKENEETILEQYCRTYIVTEKEKELLDKLQSFANSYKEIKTFLLENKLVNGMTVHGMDNFISEGNGSEFYTSTKIEINKKAFVHLLRIPEILARMK